MPAAWAEPCHAQRSGEKPAGCVHFALSHRRDTGGKDRLLWLLLILALETQCCYRLQTNLPNQRPAHKWIRWRNPHTTLAIHHCPDRRDGPQDKTGRARPSSLPGEATHQDGAPPV